MSEHNSSNIRARPRQHAGISLADFYADLAHWCGLEWPKYSMHAAAQEAVAALADAKEEIERLQSELAAANDLIAHAIGDTTSASEGHKADSRLAGNIEYCLAKINPATDVHAILTQVLLELRAPAHSS